MPIYEYQCPQCDHVFEEWVNVHDQTDERPCPHCQTAAPHILSNTAFVLKGGGWYVTDYGYRKDVKEGGEANSTPSDTATGADTNTGTTGSSGTSATDATAGTDAVKPTQSPPVASAPAASPPA